MGYYFGIYTALVCELSEVIRIKYILGLGTEGIRRGCALKGVLHGNSLVSVLGEMPGNRRPADGPPLGGAECAGLLRSLLLRSARVGARGSGQ